MELWKIGDSPAAPKFNIISSPNDWAKAVRSSGGNRELTENNLFQLDFWQGLTDYLKANRSILRTRKAQAQHWYDFAIGSSLAHLCMVVSVKDNFIRAEFYITNNKELYNMLFEKKVEIEKLLGFPMDWQELPNAKASRIAVQKDVTNIKDEKQIKEAYEWYKIHGEILMKIVTKYL
ncbi:MAG: DUF4268 domain-containing protein [Spirochaetaceae bacterium]|nr:MAG: DUF4268 domain-containing protein [Spirochaetaceae bacterium]